MHALAEAHTQFVKLEMGEMEVMEPVIMQRRTVLTSACEPGGNRPFAVAKYPHSSRDTQPFGQRGQDFPDACDGVLSR